MFRFSFRFTPVLHKKTRILNAEENIEKKLLLYLYLILKLLHSGVAALAPGHGSLLFVHIFTHKGPVYVFVCDS